VGEGGTSKVLQIAERLADPKTVWKEVDPGNIFS
jgi:hypothetical protein